MRRQGRLLFSLSICFGFFLLSCEGAVAGQGGLKGEVSINGVKVPNIVLYLLPANGIAPKPAPMEHTIAQEGLQFAPAFSIVTTGSTIFFENRDDNIHNVRSESPSNSFNIGSHLPKTVKSIVLKNSGLVSLKCKVHPEMNGLIFVSPTTLFSRTDAVGIFEILNVPPGDYLLELWHQSFTRRELVGNVKKINIAAEMKTVSINLTASGGLSQEMVSHSKQNWFVEMKAVARGLEEVLDKWEREKKRSALTKIMRTYSALYMESGLRNAIAKNFGEPRALNQEEQFNQIRKWIQGLKGKIDVPALEKQVSALISELEKDVQAIKGH